MCHVRWTVSFRTNTKSYVILVDETLYEEWQMFGTLFILLQDAQ